MLKGFRDFILRGNVIDLAVAVVMGVAFGAVVNSVVKNLVTPVAYSIFDDIGALFKRLIPARRPQPGLEPVTPLRAEVETEVD